MLFFLDRRENDVFQIEGKIAYDVLQIEGKTEIGCLQIERKMR